MHGPIAVQPHDLLWGLPACALPVCAPSWAVEAMTAGQPVVVRRAVVAAGRTAVGIRGRSREQRYATQMHVADIQRRVVPEQLISRQPSNSVDRLAWKALAQIRPAMDDLGLAWGVSGSAGFELASGCAALHADSDLDLIVRTPARFDRSDAAQLLARLDGAACRIDVQLQLPAGGIALREWAGTAQKVLLKTDHGPRLTDDPWRPGGQPA